MFNLAAQIVGHGMDPRIVCCFDPGVVIARLREVFPEVEVLPDDFAWRDYESFRRQGAGEGALRLAMSDARRRGPSWHFRLPLPEQRSLRGRAERYDVTLFSEQPIPEPTRSRFIHFLEGLRFALCVELRIGDEEDGPE